MIGAGSALGLVIGYRSGFPLENLTIVGSRSASSRVLARRYPTMVFNLFPSSLETIFGKRRKGAAVEESRADRDSAFLHLGYQLHAHFAAHGLAVYKRDRGNGVFRTARVAKG